MSDRAARTGATTRITEAKKVTEDHLILEADGHITEALDEEGRVWRVTMITPGVSHNNRQYKAEVLKEAISLYEGAKSFDGHRDEHTRRSSAISNMAGWHENIEVAPDGSLTSEFHISEAREDVRKHFVSVWKANRPDLIGFSHDVRARTEAITAGGRRISNVTKIVGVNSVDVVADPSAGGRIERLVASRQEEETMKTLEDFLKALRSGELSEDQIKEAYDEHPEWEQIVEASGAAEPAPEPTPPPEPIVEATPPPTPTPDPPAPAPLSDAVRGLVIGAAVEGSGLPQAAHEQLTEALAEAEEGDFDRLIKETKGIWDTSLAATPAALPGQGVSVGEDDAEKRQHALDAMLNSEASQEGVPAFRSLREAYVAFTGRNPYTMGEEDFNRWIFAESMGALPYAGAERLTESMTTASWAEALGDSITRRLIRAYSDNAYQSWRQVVSDITNPSDFRTNRRVRIGGYNTLPTVAEGGAYTALTSPTDEEATYAIAKKGGTEDYTLEMVAGDDLQGLRRIPSSLGRAAALTLYREIWNTVIAGNAVIYDTDTLFHDANHGNDNATVPLAEAGIETLRTRMMDQQQPGETSGFIGVTPRILVVPSELWVTAFKLAGSNVAVVSGEAATTPNPFQGMTVIEVPTLTDVNDWFLVADPASIPTIEVGFYQGRQDPELLIQDQPAVGSVFTADKFTWKIRHIWGLTVLDYRGFQRATNT